MTTNQFSFSNPSRKTDDDQPVFLLRVSGCRRRLLKSSLNNQLTFTMRYHILLLAVTALLCGLTLGSCADDPDPDISGRVLLADGTPAAGVEVMIAYHLERLDVPGPATDADSGSLSDISQRHCMESQLPDRQPDGNLLTSTAFDTNRIYQPLPNPSCDGLQSITFELADSASVTMFARSLHGLTDYDLLFMEPYPPGRHTVNYRMLPGLYDINATFIADTLVSFIVPEVAFLEWNRDGRIDCPGGPGFPTERIAVTDDRGRFSANRDDLIWRPRIFKVTGTDGAAHRLGVHAALFARLSPEPESNSPVPATHLREIELTRPGHFIELTMPVQ